MVVTKVLQKLYSKTMIPTYKPITWMGMLSLLWGKIPTLQLNKDDYFSKSCSFRETFYLCEHLGWIMVYGLKIVVEPTISGMELLGALHR